MSDENYSEKNNAKKHADEVRRSMEKWNAEFVAGYKPGRPVKASVGAIMVASAYDYAKIFTGKFPEENPLSMTISATVDCPPVSVLKQKQFDMGSFLALTNATNAANAKNLEAAVKYSKSIDGFPMVVLHHEEVTMDNIVNQCRENLRKAGAFKEVSGLRM